MIAGLRRLRRRKGRMESARQGRRGNSEYVGTVNKDHDSEEICLK